MMVMMMIVKTLALVMMMIVRECVDIDRRSIQKMMMMTVRRGPCKYGQDGCCDNVDDKDYIHDDVGDNNEYLTRSSSSSCEKSTEAEDYRSLVLLRSSTSSSLSSSST